MCGRYAASSNPDDLVMEFEIVDPDARANALGRPIVPDYNLAPTKSAPVVLERAPSEDRDAAPVRQLRSLVWGLVPSWATARSVGARMINARGESLLDKPAFRRAASTRRCLVPADGWYEWQASPTATDARGKPRKQPFLVTGSDVGILAFAGVYEFWRDGSRDADDPDAWLTTYAIVTIAAEPALRRLHDRMPLAMPRDRWQDWLSPAVTEADSVRAMLAPPSPGGFQAVPVSTQVNDVRNNAPDLLRPLPRNDLVGAVDPATGELLGGQDAALF